MQMTPSKTIKATHQIMPILMADVHHELQQTKIFDENPPGISDILYADAILLLRGSEQFLHQFMETIMRFGKHIDLK